MRKIEITMEKTMRITKFAEATDEDLELLKSGENPFADELEEELAAGRGIVEYDFAVNDMDGKEIVPWK